MTFYILLSIVYSLIASIIIFLGASKFSLAEKIMALTLFGFGFILTVSIRYYTEKGKLKLNLSKRMLQYLGLIATLSAIMRACMHFSDH